jgi:hypothetical protein
MPITPPKDRHLLVTMTNEPFQPVRLYDAVMDRALVRRKLAGLRWMIDAPMASPDDACRACELAVIQSCSAPGRDD